MSGDYVETLDQLGVRAKGLLSRIEQTRVRRMSLQASLGQVLLEAQARVQAGEAGEGVKWQEWCVEHMPFSHRTAQKYMQIASAQDAEAKLREINNWRSKKHEKEVTIVENAPTCGRKDNGPYLSLPAPSPEPIPVPEPELDRWQQQMDRVWQMGTLEQRRLWMKRHV